jgi:hypothetical protein
LLLGQSYRNIEFCQGLLTSSQGQEFKVPLSQNFYLFILAKLSWAGWKLGLICRQVCHSLMASLFNPFFA